MATRSYICIEEADGKMKGIYCHCDGYLTHNGAMLLDHYDTREKVEQLIALGSLSYLGQKAEPNPKQAHSFDSPQDGVVIAYGRDRGEKNTEARNVDLEELDKDAWIEYTYVFGKDEKWRYFTYGDYSEVGMLDLQEGVDAEFGKLGITRPKGIYGYFPPQFVRKLQRMQQNEDSTKKEELFTL